ncbi:MAG: S1 RNA-binding domain-containing protein, partial [Acidobacteriaceae bacterium]
MAHVAHPEQTESNPLNTELETPTLEAPPESAPSTESTHNPEASAPEAIAAPVSLEDHLDEHHEEPDLSMEDFAAALESFDREQAAEAAAQAFDDSTIVAGTVIKITDKHVVVDVGMKSEGLIPIEQVTDYTGQPKVHPGETIEVVIEREEPEGGYLLSYEKAQRLRVWDSVEKAHNEKTPLTGTVVGRVKGGLTVDVGIKAFLPGSQLELRPVRNLDAYIGQPIQVRVIKLNKKRGNVVVSRKEILEEEQTSRRSQTLEHLEEGAVLTGTVKNLTDYGAFVDLGGIDGLLHITDMSWGRLTHPRDLVNVGDEIQVKVLKFDKEKQRVSLGFKQLTPDPWLDAAERYPIGAHVRGRVLSVTDYGAFVE